MLASPLRHPRVGFVVPKYGQNSVERNRLKRQLREIVRTHILAMLPSIDLVIRVQPRSYESTSSVLLEELQDCVEMARRTFQ